MGTLNLVLLVLLVWVIALSAIMVRHMVMHHAKPSTNGANEQNRDHKLIWAFGVTAVMGSWILSGELAHDSPSMTARDFAMASIAEDVIAAVRTRVSHAKTYVDHLVIRGRTAALRTVNVKAETVGRVIATPAQEGSRVSAGETLCELSLDTRPAQLSKAQATAWQRWLDYDAARQLHEKGHRTKNHLATARAAYETARASLKEIELDVERTRIRAPFAGLLDKRTTEVGDFMEAGDDCATIIDDQPFLVIGYVSETEVGQLNVGNPGTAHLITGEIYEGRIRFVGGRAESETRTFRVELELPNEDRTLREGTTAEIRVPLEAVKAHNVSPSVLVLNDDGEVGVRAVGDNSKVFFMPVEIADDEDGNYWLTGLPDRIRIIILGQDYVSEDQVVREDTLNDGVVADIGVPIRRMERK